MESFDTVTRQGGSILTLFWIELAISAVLLVGVVGVMTVALVRFRARTPDAPDPPQVHGNRRLEIVWTVTPALTLAVIFILVVATMRSVDTEQPGAQPVTIVGHQWWWEYSYPDQQVITANELHVPVGGSVQLSLQSVDVIHSFHVPRFGWMQDLVPGKSNSMSVTVERPGIFDGTCNQYCGLQHAWMRVRVVAEPMDQYQAWMQQQRQPVTPAGSRGEQVFMQNTCVTCHLIRGLNAPIGNIGPDLTHLGSRATLGAGVIDNTPDNVRQWIANPQSIKPGVLMPAFQSLPPADLDALVNYLESLK